MDIEFLKSILDSHGVNGVLSVCLVSMFAYCVKLFYSAMRDLVHSAKEDTSKLLAVNHEIGTNSANAMNALCKAFHEFSISSAFEHKEVVNSLDVKHKEVVSHLYDIKKKIDELPRK